MSNYTDFFTFNCDYETLETTRKLSLYFFPRDNSIELYDFGMKRVLLKRTVTEISLNDIYIGATLHIFGKKIVVKSYGNQQTEHKMTKIKQRAFLMIKPEARQFLGDIVAALEKNKLSIRNVKMLKLQSLEAVQFLNQRGTSEDNISTLMENLTSGPIIVFDINGENAIENLKKMCGSGDYDAAKNNSPTSFYALYGFDNIRTGILISKDSSTNQRDLDFFFSHTKMHRDASPKFQKSTLCIIKPHIVREEKSGSIIRVITENGFSISALKMLHLNRLQCEKFFDVYKGVVDDFMSMVLQLQSGTCLAIEVQGMDEEVHSKFRALCGPTDPEIARILRPNTIRAQFGTDKIMNAVHCTDLESDVLIELKFIFGDLE